MKTFISVLLLLSVPALAADSAAVKPKPQPKLVYRTLDKMLKQLAREAEAKLVAKR